MNGDSGTHPPEFPLQVTFWAFCEFSRKGFSLAGEPGRTRTSNPLIKSQLLYH